MEMWKQFWEARRENFKLECLQEREKFLNALDNPLKTQEKTLKDILRTSVSSEFGKEHHVEHIQSVEQFQRQIPVRSYNEFKPWIEKEVEQKGGVFSQSTLKRWLKTSGSTGDSKKIPYTQYWMEQYRVPALKILWANYLSYCPEMLDSPYATLDTQTVREIPQDFLHGIPYQGITNRNQLLSESDWCPPWYEAPWFTDNVPEGYDDRMYARLRHLVGQDLKAILTINPSTLVALAHQFEKHLPKLIEEVINGTVEGKAYYPPNPVLAKKLSQCVLDEQVNFKLLWPNLSLLGCWTSASANLYLPQLARIYPGARILPFMTCGTEGIVTLPVDEHQVTGPLAITQGFYEFLPAEVDLDAVISAEKGVPALQFHQLKEGEEYHLIMTHASGLLRYSVGDIYKVTGFYKGVPRIEFSRRQGTYFSFTGEKLTESQWLMAIQATCEQYNLAGSLFMCCPAWGDQPYYRVLIEASSEQQTKPFANMLANALDKQLRIYNEEYDSKRKSDRLGNIKIELIPLGSVEKFQEQEKQTKNAIQFKYKPFQADDVLFNKVLSMAS